MTEMPRHWIFVRRFNYLEAPISHLHGQQCCSSSELCFGDQRRPRRQRRFRGQQMCLRNGSSLPLPCHSYSPPHRLVDRSHSEVSYILSHTFAQSLKSVLQEELQVLSSMVLDSGSLSRVSELDVRTEEDIDNYATGLGEDHVSVPFSRPVYCYPYFLFEELFTSDRNIERVLDQCGIDLSRDLDFDLLAQLQNAWRPVFWFFCCTGRRLELFHDSRTYDSMMVIIRKMRRFKSMLAMLEEMRNQGLLIIEALSISIQAFTAAREVKKAAEISGLMRRHNFRAGVGTFNCLLDAPGRSKLGKEAQGFSEKLKNRSLPDL